MIDKIQQSIVIIGTGQAGYTVAREFRKLDPDMPLTLISMDDGRSYPKPMLSNALSAGKTADDIALASVEQMQSQLDATILPHMHVTAIDIEHNKLKTAGAGIDYNQLVLAIGADPIRLPFEGDAADEVLSINNLHDYANFRNALGHKSRVAIIGGGLIGCEFANDLISQSHETHVIDLADWPLGRLLPEAAGLAVQQKLADTGITWHLKTSVKSIDHDADAVKLTLADGDQVMADVVLSAIGLRPKTELAKQAGLTVNRGIVTDRYLQTSATDIYALGDCAEVEGLVLPFIMPIMHAARALAKTLAGDKTMLTYPAMPVVVKTPDCPLVVSPPGANTPGEWQIQQDDDGITALFMDEQGQLAGFALIGDATKQRQSLTNKLPHLLI